MPSLTLPLTAFTDRKTEEARGETPRARLAFLLGAEERDLPHIDEIASS